MSSLFVLSSDQSVRVSFVRCRFWPVFRVAYIYFQYTKSETPFLLFFSSSSSLSLAQSKASKLEPYTKRSLCKPLAHTCEDRKWLEEYWRIKRQITGKNDFSLTLIHSLSTLSLSFSHFEISGYLLYSPSHSSLTLYTSYVYFLSLLHTITPSLTHYPTQLRVKRWERECRRKCVKRPKQMFTRAEQIVEWVSTFFLRSQASIKVLRTSFVFSTIGSDP